jgi:hypothetical protein
MSSHDRPLYSLEITEDSSTGVSIRLKHSGRIPDVLAGIPKDVLRKARPWLWNRRERQVLQKASSMNPQTFRIVRDTLLAERARVVMSQMQQRDGQPRLSWLERRRQWRAQQDRIHDATLQEHFEKQIAVREATRDEAEWLRGESDGPLEKRELTATELLRQQEGIELAQPRVVDRGRQHSP